MKTGAILSPDRTYRYLLWREWNPVRPTVLFNMLNPSTADAENDDPTIRRGVGFAKEWGYGRFEATNLCAFRSSDPKQLNLLGHPDPIGPENDKYILEAAERAKLVILAWGAIPGWLIPRAKKVREILSSTGKRVYHLGLTKSGQPRHPLYVLKDKIPEALT